MWQFEKSPQPLAQTATPEILTLGTSPSLQEGSFAAAQCYTEPQAPQGGTCVMLKVSASAEFKGS